MKVQQLALSFWDQIPSSPSSSSTSSSSLSISFKRLRPLAPKLEADADAITSVDLSGLSSPKPKCTTFDHESGGGRWNPTPEQIRMLEALYRGGMRTPNAHQIERITAELGKHGRIQGKNVFYWFQNHKARERQKQKRSALLALRSAPPAPIMPLFSHSRREEQEEQEGEGEQTKEGFDGSCKRKCRSWGVVGLAMEEGGGHEKTLELFPLHPEKRS